MPVMVGSNSDEASVMAVFGVDIAGQIQNCAASGGLASD
jgi:para-nitrobenzyl esterase